MKYFLSLICLLGITTVDVAICKAGTSECVEYKEFPKLYSDLMCKGDEYMKIGDYKSAIEAYKSATYITLYDSPNFQVLPKLAMAYCKNGDKQEGFKILDEFKCMFSIYKGESMCYVDNLYTQKNSNLSQRCFAEMCGEMYMSYYGAGSESFKKNVSKLNKLLDEAIKACN